MLIFTLTLIYHAHLYHGSVLHFSQMSVSSGWPCFWSLAFCAGMPYNREKNKSLLEYYKNSQWLKFTKIYSLHDATDVTTYLSFSAHHLPLQYFSPRIFLPLDLTFMFSLLASMSRMLTTSNPPSLYLTKNPNKVNIFLKSYV